MNINITLLNAIELSIQHKLSILDIVILYLSYTNNQNLHKEFEPIISIDILKNLVKLGYIINTDNPPIVTKKTIEMFTKLNLSILDNSITTNLQNELDKHTISAWIDEFRILFKGKKPGSMGDKNLCIDRMTEFMQSNNYTKLDILRATSKYIDNMSMNNYLYLRKAHYFIQKTDIIDGKRIKISDLQTYCDELDDNTDNNQSLWQNGLMIG